MLILMTLQHRTSRVKSIGMVSDATTIMRIWLAMEALMGGIAQADEDDEVRQEYKSSFTRLRKQSTTSFHLLTEKSADQAGRKSQAKKCVR